MIDQDIDRHAVVERAMDPENVALCKTVGEGIRDELEESLGRRRAELWFRDADVVDVNADGITVAVPTEAHRTWLQCIYADALQDACDTVLGSGIDIHVEVCQAQEARRTVREALPSREREWLRLLSQRRVLPSFENFHTNNASRFAVLLLQKTLHGARTSAAGEPACIVMHGEAGTGKSHLLQAFYALSQRLHPGVSKLQTARTMTRRFVAAVRGGSSSAVRALEADLCKHRFLLIDDLQNLSGRKATQQHLLSLMDRIASSGTVLIVASQIRVTDLPAMSPQLRSRLTGGVGVHLPSPCREQRAEILAQRGVRGLKRPPRDVVDAILDRSHAFEASIDLMDRWTVASAQAGNVLGPDWLDELAPPPAASARDEVVARTKALVADHYGLPRELLDHTTKVRRAALPRRIAMYLVFRACSMPLKQLGVAFGLRSHSSVSRALSEVRELRRINPDVEQLIEGLLARL